MSESWIMTYIPRKALFDRRGIGVSGLASGVVRGRQAQAALKHRTSIREDFDEMIYHREYSEGNCDKCSNKTHRRFPAENTDGSAARNIRWILRRSTPQNDPLLILLYLDAS